MSNEGKNEKIKCDGRLQAKFSPHGLFPPLDKIRLFEKHRSKAIFSRSNVEDEISLRFGMFPELLNADSSEMRSIPSDYKAAVSIGGSWESARFLLIAEQGVMDTLIQHLLSGNATGNLRRVNGVYAEKQEYTSGKRTLEQFLKALMYITPELI
ncbi:hypothetical protein T10_12346 [Trichinella papuae]|uniref:Uncharacterized protein n=1 Tax=Trichinella papuae TaxID=268474 RepID=A0A0V1MTT8_9BILA|nr:hypothetical protein T10_12346 [Trichinella papuae]